MEEVKEIEKLSSYDAMCDKNKGPNFYSKKQTINVNLKSEITPVRMKAIREHMEMLKS